MFVGFDVELLTEAFKAEAHVIRKLQGQNDRRGNIVRLEGDLQVPSEPQQDGLLAHRNGIEETLCSFRLKQNIGEARQADVFTPLGGRIGGVTGFDLPILKNMIKLSARRAFLYKVCYINLTC